MQRGSGNCASDGGNDLAAWEFRRTRRGRSTWLVGPEFTGTDLVEALAGGEPHLRQRYAAEPVRSAVTSRVYRCHILTDSGPEVLYYKEYLDRSVWDALKHVVRPTRAMRAYRASRMLAAHGFCVPRIIAVGHRRVRWVFRRPILVTGEVSRSELVLRLLTKAPDDPGAMVPRARRELLRTLGRVIGRMHRARIVHGDLRLGNVLARREGDSWELFFLDNERTRRYPWLPARLRLKNLVQMNMIRPNVSRADRLRVFQAYLSECPDLQPQSRIWMKKVLRRTAERLRAP